MPILFRPCCIAANMVVPLPQKGSTTVSSTNEYICIKRDASSNGNGAGWSCFVDAPGSSQICENHF